MRKKYEHKNIEIASLQEKIANLNAKVREERAHHADELEHMENSVA